MVDLSDYLNHTYVGYCYFIWLDSPHGWLCRSHTLPTVGWTSPHCPFLAYCSGARPSSRTPVDWFLPWFCDWWRTLTDPILITLDIGFSSPFRYRAHIYAAPVTLHTVVTDRLRTRLHTHAHAVTLHLRTHSCHMAYVRFTTTTHTRYPTPHTHTRWVVGCMTLRRCTLQHYHTRTLPGWTTRFAAFTTFTTTRARGSTVTTTLLVCGLRTLLFTLHTHTVYVGYTFTHTAHTHRRTLRTHAGCVHTPAIHTGSHYTTHARFARYTGWFGWTGSVYFTVTGLPDTLRTHTAGSTVVLGSALYRYVQLPRLLRPTTCLRLPSYRCALHTHAVVTCLHTLLRARLLLPFCLLPPLGLHTARVIYHTGLH